MLNSIGLVFDIVGVIILAISPVQSNGPSEDGSFQLAVQDSPEETGSQAREYSKRVDRHLLAYILIALGFVLQLVSNFISNA